MGHLRNGGVGFWNQENRVLCFRERGGTYLLAMYVVLVFVLVQASYAERINRRRVYEKKERNWISIQQQWA